MLERTLEKPLDTGNAELIPLKKQFFSVFDLFHFAFENVVDFCLFAHELKTNFPVGVDCFAFF